MFTLTENQLNNAMGVIDTTLRALGLGALEASHVLAGKFSKATKEEDEFIVSLSEEEVQAFLQACDIAVKQVGLQGASPIMELANLFASK